MKYITLFIKLFFFIIFALTDLIWGTELAPLALQEFSGVVQIKPQFFSFYDLDYNLNPAIFVSPFIRYIAYSKFRVFFPAGYVIDKYKYFPHLRAHYILDYSQEPRIIFLKMLSSNVALNLVAFNMIDCVYVVSAFEYIYKEGYDPGFIHRSCILTMLADQCIKNRNTFMVGADLFDSYIVVLNPMPPIF